MTVGSYMWDVFTTDTTYVDRLFTWQQLADVMHYAFEFWPSMQVWYTTCVRSLLMLCETHAMSFVVHLV